MTITDPGAVTDLLARLHDLATERLAAWSYRGDHEGVDLSQPPWWQGARSLARATRQTEAARPAADPVVINRDFHPGNVLWVEGNFSGVVDWVHSCIGSAPFDASHVRMNLAVLHGQEVANRLIAGDPAWDIEAAFGFSIGPTPATVADCSGPWPRVTATLRELASRPSSRRRSPGSAEATALVGQLQRCRLVFRVPLGEHMRFLSTKSAGV